MHAKVLTRGVNVREGRVCVCGGGGGGGAPSHMFFSQSPNECSRSKNINCLKFNRCDFYCRTTKYFRLNHPKDFGYMNVSSIDL